MPSKSTRRDVLKAGVTGAAALAAGVAVSQEPKAQPTVDVASVEAQLAKPLPERAKKILKTTLQNNANSHTERLKFKLPENSEPCTTYVASAVVVKR